MGRRSNRKNVNNKNLRYVHISEWRCEHPNDLNSKIQIENIPNLNSICTDVLTNSPQKREDSLQKEN